MHYNFFIADPHFCHLNIIKFKDVNGRLIRSGFKSIEDHDNLIIDNINKVVRPQDKLFLLGDVLFKKKNLEILDRINTKKRILIKGNHDLFKLKDYIKYFKDIRAYKMLPEHGIIFSHIPVHPNNLSARFNLNVHGHIHQNIYPDKKYLNICCEQTNYKPLELEEILNILKERNIKSNL